MDYETTFEVSLPLCTDNHMYITSPNGKRHKSSKYKAWLKTAGWEYVLIRNQWIRDRKPVVCYSCPVRVEMLITQNVKKGISKNPRDLTNHTKQSIDFLVNVGLLKDDDLVSSFSCEWSDQTNGIIYTISPYTSS